MVNLVALALALSGPAWAGGVELLTEQPVLADGAGTVVVHAYIPDLTDADTLKLKPFEGELLNQTRQGELLTLTLRPPEAFKADQMRIAVKVRGGMKLDEDLLIPLAPVPRARVDITASAPVWTAGDRSPVTLTLKPAGTHDLPASAHALAVRASQGTVKVDGQNPDGSWTATWTPPSHPEPEQVVLFAATDLTRPDQVHGQLTMPVDKAPEGATLPVLIAPMAPGLPTSQAATAWVLSPGGDPTLSDGTAGVSAGGGWSSFALTAPDAPGSWSVEVQGGGASDKVDLKVVDAVPRLTLSADPPVMDSQTRNLTVVATVTDPAGQPLPRRKVRFSAEGASVNGSTRDNGDGSYTQRWRVSSSVDAAVITASVTLSATGLPPARVLAWTGRPTVPSNGTTQTPITLMALDAYGLPVPGVSFSLTTPRGDGAAPPSVKADANGVAVVRYRSGTTPGPARLRAVTDSGLVGEVVLWQQGGAGVSLPPSGDAPAQQALATWQGAVPTLALNRVDGKTGAPAALVVSTTPTYTTPGAAILITVQVFDATGQPVPAKKPQITASIGTVGAITDSGDGSYLVPVQLPPGQDGPLQVDVEASGVKGSAVLPTLASLGGTSALQADGTVAKAEPDKSRGGGGGRPDPGFQEATLLTFRVTPFDMIYSYSATSETGAGASPLGAAFTEGYPFGVLGTAVHLELWPTRGAVGIDARTKVGAWRMALGAGQIANNVIDPVFPSAVGVRFRYDVAATPLRLTGGAWGQIGDTLVFEYADDAHASAVPVSRMIYGARLGVGFELDTNRVDLRLEGAETFGPLPAMTHATAGLDLAILPDPLFLSLGADLDMVHRRFRVGEGDLEDQVTVRSRQIAGMVGIGASL
ncbi:MAG: Ig-like domain-containing protein [Alphaproteobacteria bacterium]|nr:Ig-like domain-containing protein [Alphaproteobacteria bacterium]